MGLIGILLTSLVMGIGVTGILPLDQWQMLVDGELGQHGESPQLAAGQIMFGEAGYYLMAVASVTATLGTLTITFAAIPRIIQSIAADGYLLGGLSKYFAKEHSSLGTPVNSIILTLFIFLAVALSAHAVVDWILSASYLWILIYMAFHLLVLAAVVQNRQDEIGAFSIGFVATNALLGFVATVITLYYAFMGSHQYYGSRAMVVLIASGVLVAVSSLLVKPKNGAEPSKVQSS